MSGNSCQRWCRLGRIVVHVPLCEGRRLDTSPGGPRAGPGAARACGTSGRMGGPDGRPERPIIPTPGSALRDGPPGHGTCRDPGPWGPDREARRCLSLWAATGRPGRCMGPCGPWDPGQRAYGVRYAEKISPGARREHLERRNPSPTGPWTLTGPWDPGPRAGRGSPVLFILRRRRPSGPTGAGGRARRAGGGA
jgi:hypothetical protein